MLNNIEEFMKNITIRDKDYSIYEDKEKGVMFPMNTVQLLARVDYYELDKTQFEKSVFEKKIEKLDYKEIKAKRAVVKSQLTGKKEDETTIAEADTDVKQIWNVTNAVGVYKSFTNKDDALALAKDINKTIFMNL